ncbi:MAG: peptide chain release factor N(5)-glutamine methyltransferase [Alphaproteobacteria bacterium]|nr:peptide chain release factor N(5)-glutamine methyltransferase [Alphaproteobacteria bacterium]
MNGEADTLAATSTLREAIAQAARRLAAAGVADPRLDARLLVGAALALSREAIVADPDRAVGAKEHAAIDAMVRRREAREPVARIIGEREFWSLRFAVTPATLEPRPDSETVIEAALDAFPDRDKPLRVIDLGTGTGCLLLAFLSEYPNATGIGVDVSPQAVDAAATNARRLGFDTRAQFVVDDWARSLSGPFDCILANPPYIPSSDLAGLAPEVGYDPHAALDGGPDGLSGIESVMHAAARLLGPNGRAFVEIGAGQSDSARRSAERNGLRFAGMRADMGQIPRVIALNR